MRPCIAPSKAAGTAWFQTKRLDAALTKATQAGSSGAMRHDLLTLTVTTTALGGVIGIRVPVAGVTTTTGTFEGPGWPN
ncbi:hypothetical protein GCM10028794_13190 [Silanimonas algicola]